MPTANFNDTVIAQSDRTQFVEGNHYFPREDVRTEYLTATDHHTTCPWKGDASHFSLQVDGVEESNAAWTYAEPKPDAAHIADHIAFYPSVTVTD